MPKRKTVHEFKAGQEVDLDSIYTIQGLNDGKPWFKTKDPNNDLDEEIVITRDIKITIIIETP